MSGHAARVCGVVSRAGGGVEAVWWDGDSRRGAGVRKCGGQV